MRKPLAVLATAIVLAAACGDPSDTQADTAARGALVEQLRARGEGAAHNGIAQHLEELLPNVALQPPSGALVRPVRYAVVGTIADAEPGRAFRNPAPDERGVVELADFADPQADWRSIHLQVDVEESLGDDVGDGPIEVGLAISGGKDPFDLIEGAKALGRVVLLLDDRSGVFAYDRSLYSIVLDGDTVVTVADDGTLDLPAMEPAFARSFQGDLRTFDDLRRAATGPTKIIAVDEPSPGSYVRPWR